MPPGGFDGALPFAWLPKGDAGAAFLGFSFFGFFASRLLRCWPLAMAASFASQVGATGEQIIEVRHHAVNQFA